MDLNLLDSEYIKLENSRRRVSSRDTGAIILNLNTVKLISLFNNTKSDVLTLIPNISVGELSLCAHKWMGYSIVNGIATDSSNGEIISKDFLEDDINQKFQSIIVFPPFGVRTEHGRSEVAYINKCLDLLDDNGRLIALIPQNIATAMAFKNLRERVLSEFSLEAVISLKQISMSTGVECSLLVIENKSQTDKIYMSVDVTSADEIYDGFLHGTRGFYTNSSDVYDRIDANYFDPKYKEIRNLVQNRDTVKVGELADVFSGMMIPSQERKDYGDYLVIKPQYIFDAEVHLGNERKVFCSKAVIDSDRRGRRCILKKGDVLISTVGKINWAIYSGDDDFAVANQNVAIIRGNDEADEWLKLFFSSKTGIEYLESQLKFFSHCGVFRHVSVQNLASMAVPDIKMMKVTDRVKTAMDLEAKVAALFRDLGWDVRENYGANDFRYDMALFFNGTMRAVVEVKSYTETQINRDRRFAIQLAMCKEKVGDASVYLFIDDEIYEYEAGNLEQLTELPRPEKRKTERRQTKTEKTSHSSIQIEKKSIEEMSLTDRMLLETATRYDEILASLNRIEGKVDDIAEKIESLSKQISGYQSLVDKQLDMAVSSEEEERIIHAFSEECAERIIGEVDAKGTNREYNTELQKLILSFGEPAWNKMEESTRTFLVSSKVIFNNLIGLHDIVDYSGVCLLVTKALEVEMGKRFCKNFLAYLKEKYPGRSNHVQFPTVLLDKYGKPIKPKHFTLGSVAYVLCYLKASDLTVEQDENNQAKLLEYAKDKLFAGKTDDEIMSILADYAESVEEVKNDYRNPSAHTNELRRVDAEQCFALVLDVEKLMKRMLDSFDE